MSSRTIRRWAIPCVLALGASVSFACTDDDEGDEDGDMDAGVDSDGSVPSEDAATADAGPLTCGEPAVVCESAALSLADFGDVTLDACCTEGQCGLEQPGSAGPAECVPRNQPGEF